MSDTADDGADGRAGRWISRLADLLLFLGILSALIGVVYAINGATQAGAMVKVPVTLAAREVSGSGNIPVSVEGVDVPDGWLAAASPPNGVAGMPVVAGLPVPEGSLTLATWNSTRAEQLLNRGSGVIAGLGLLVGGLMLRPVLRSIAFGRPFDRGNARRIVVLAATVAVAGSLGPLPPATAGDLVLERIGLAGSPAFTSTPWFTFDALYVGALLLALAAAFRAGEQLTRDADGLV